MCSEAKVVLAMLQSVTASRHGMDMARSGHKKAPRRNPPANEGRKYRLYPSDDADQAMTSWGHTRRTINEIAKLKARQAGRRLDLTHKLTTDLAKNHGYVGREDLAVKNMTASAKGTIEEPGKNVAAKAGLNRSILDNIPGERARQLAYKATWYGSVDLAVPAPGTSQTCPECHERDPLSRKRCGRLFACVHCGYQGHADKVASIEIDRRAGELLARIVGEALVITGGHPVNSTGRGTRKVTPSQSPRAKGASVNRPQGHGPSTSAAA
jgi:Zn ribbon nucleic-acid-binding protein